MSIPYFQLAANQLFFPNGVQAPGNEPLRKIQATDRTAGGTLKVENLGITTNQIMLVFSAMDKFPTYRDLKNWFDNISNGATVSFTYVDHFANSYSVIWLDDILNFSEFEPGYMQGQILLEVI